MSDSVLKCKVTDTELKKRFGETINLNLDKAKRLSDKGLVTILPSETDLKVAKKYNITPGKIGVSRLNVDKSTIDIPLIIPYIRCGKIGQAYNEAMDTMVKDWVLFIDHDILLVNPLWYDICKNAINKVGDKAGWISCYTNRIGCKFQVAPEIDKKSDNIKYHREYAKNLYQNNRGKIKDFTEAKNGQFSGMFILTNKRAWEAVGGFKEDGFFNIDCQYYTGVKRAGFRTYIMQDLYVYHGYFREVLKPYFTKC